MVTKCSLKKAVAICSERWDPETCSKKIDLGLAVEEEDAVQKVISGIEIRISVVGPEFDGHLEFLDYTVCFLA